MLKYILVILVVIIVSIAIQISKVNATTVTKVIQQKNSVSWTAETTRKYNVLVGLGMDKEVARALITECKRTAKNASLCVKIGASILGAESTLGTKCTENYNCVGMDDWRIKYPSKEIWIKDWVRRYNIFWYNQKNPSSFYSLSKENPPVTRYCMGGSLGFCADWYKNSWNIFNKLNSF